MQDKKHKQTFESVLRECGFRIITGLRSSWEMKCVTVIILPNRCQVFVNDKSILCGYIRRPERLKVLIDILLETR